MAEDRLAWVPLYPSKLLGALGRMKPDEGYLYWIVCLRIYEVGGPCRDNLDNLARLSGMNRRRVSDALDKLFRAGKLERQGDGIMNPFAREVLADATALREERKRAGQEGGKRSAEKRKSNQRQAPSKASAPPQQEPTHLQLQLQDSLFPNGNRAPDNIPKSSESSGSPSMKDPPLDAEADFYRRGREVLGKQAGGMLTKLLRAKGGNVALARAGLEQASTRGDAASYVGAMIRNGGDHHGRKDLGGFAGVGARIRARRANADAAPAGEDDAPEFRQGCGPVDTRSAVVGAGDRQAAIPTPILHGRGAREA